MIYTETPVLFSHSLSKIVQSNVFLKLEMLQPSGSFKNRGIGHFCSEKVKQGITQFICSSGGNAGLAAAFAARELSVPLTVVVPLSTPSMMIDKIEGEGATVVQTGADWQEADQYARSLIQSSKICYVSPFNDPLIWSGNATLIHEVDRIGLKPDAIIVSVGGGGLFCGVVQGMHDVGWEHVPVYAVETTGAASFASALKAGRVVEIEKIDTLAKSLGARAVTEQSVRWAHRHPVISRVVSDQAAVLACQRFLSDHRLLVEPACGASLSLCYDKDVDLQKYKNILVVVCGGSAITSEMLMEWTQEVESD
ncbi:MAG: pyridoxal-phosphate dependent enzyme [Waddliaceae bacterium]